MKKRTSLQILKQLICIGTVSIVLGPIVLAPFAAFKTKGDTVKTSPLLLLPAARITFDNFKKVLGDKYLTIGFKNTGTILVVSIFFNVMFGTIAAFILERSQFRSRGVIMALFFLGMLIPSFVTEIARFKIISKIGSHNMLEVLIIIYVMSDLMQLYIYRQSISALPVSLDESALLDGCSHFGLSRRIILPLLVPATATAVIIRVTIVINDMYAPHLYMPKNRLWTLTTFPINYADAQKGSWQQSAAGIIIIMLPMVLVYIFFQRYILAGVTAEAVKE